MATYERVEQELDEAKAALKEFNEGEDGQWLAELKRKLRRGEGTAAQQRKWETEKTQLEKRQERLEAEVTKWRDKVLESTTQPASAKRDFDQAMADPTDAICTELIKPFDTVPNFAREIQPLIETPLIRKLPVAPYLFRKIHDEHPTLLDFIEISDGELQITITSALREMIGNFAGAGGSEDTLHWPLDSMNTVLLETIKRSLGGKFPIEVDRNKTDSASTTRNRTRPDLLVWVRGVLFVLGEEKAHSLKDAEDDLRSKFGKINPLLFGGIKFMISYACSGPHIRFFAIDGSMEKLSDPLLPISETLDMRTFHDRINVICTIINISRLIMTVKNSLPNITYPLGKTVKMGSSSIYYCVDHVRKTVAIQDLPYFADQDVRISFLQRMYAHAKGHSGLAQVLKGPQIDRNGNYKLSLITQGLNISPTDEYLLRKMTKNLVSGLARLHEGNFLHRDIRWPNIVYVPSSTYSNKTDGEYVLIDFEHGGPADGNNEEGVSDGVWLKGWDHRTLDDGHYTEKSELYQLGKLLENRFGSFVESEDGNDFVNRLKEKQLSATEALQHPWVRDS